MASRPRKLSNLCPLIEERPSRVKLYPCILLYRMGGARYLYWEPKTYTEIVRLAGHTMADARAFSSTHRRRITARESRKLYDLSKKKSERKRKRERDGNREINRSVGRESPISLDLLLLPFFPVASLPLVLSSFFFFQGQKHRAAHSN